MTTVYSRLGDKILCLSETFPSISEKFEHFAIFEWFKYLNVLKSCRKMTESSRKLKTKTVLEKY